MASSDINRAADERTPLLADNHDTAESFNSGETARSRIKSWCLAVWNPPNRTLLAGFIISLSFSLTQVPMIHAFRMMACDAFYSDHPPYTGTGDRCQRNEINASTSQQVAIVGITTTFFGTCNLFVSGYQMKVWGPNTALVFQTFIPAIRVATQIIGVKLGGQAGIWLIQTTQVITIIGGPAGYILILNTVLGEIVKPEERTAQFGRLQGVTMLGLAAGLLLGGNIGDTFGVVAPFETAFCLFLISSLYARFAIPYLSAESISHGAKQRARGLRGFFAPLKVLAPQKLRLASGSIKNHWGVFFLCVGNFIGVLATGFAPILIQLFATADFNFSQAQNGWLLSGNALIRALFLLFVFPRIIGMGRSWFKSQYEKTEESAKQARQQQQPGAPKRKRNSAIEEYVPEQAGEYDGPTGTQPVEAPVIPIGDDHLKKEEAVAFEFDLFFLRWSLIVDGALTAGAALVTQSWHVYLVAFLLPFGSGSAPAAKGVITSMCPSSQRTDALNAITLVENIGRLATLGVFGFVFSALAAVGQARLTFFCNGAVAVVGMLVLLFSHFPPRDGVLVEEQETDSLLGGVNPEDDAEGGRE